MYAITNYYNSAITNLLTVLWCHFLEWRLPSASFWCAEGDTNAIPMAQVLSVAQYQRALPSRLIFIFKNITKFKEITVAQVIHFPVLY